MNIMNVARRIMGVGGPAVARVVVERGMLSTDWSAVVVLQAYEVDADGRKLRQVPLAPDLLAAWDPWEVKAGLLELATFAGEGRAASELSEAVRSSEAAEVGDAVRDLLACGAK